MAQAQRTGIFEGLIERKGAKAVLRAALRSGEVNVLLSGEPASGKSVALTAMEESIPGAVFHEAAGLTEAKLRDILKENHPLLLLDEIDDMKPNAYKALATAMEDGRVTKGTMREQYDVEIDTLFFGACNEPESLPKHIQSRFRTVHFPEYEPEEYLNVCSVLLPRIVDWIDDEETAREAARIVMERLESCDVRDARDASRLAHNLPGVRDISIALRDPDADVESEPIHPDELPHLGGGGDDSNGEYAEAEHEGYVVRRDTVKGDPEQLARMANLSQEALDAALEDWENVKDQIEGIPTAGGGSTTGAAEEDGVIVEINQGFAESADEGGDDDDDGPMLSISEGMELHHMEEDHEKVHAVVAEMLDSTPENLYDPELESDVEGFDLYYRFDLTRDSGDEPFRSRRFYPEDLIDTLEEADIGSVLIRSKGFI